jgi:RNA recognition motif-containing protein
MADAPNDSAAAPSGTKIFVGNLSFNVDKDNLEKHFARAGKVLSANVITRGNRSRGYGFVEMATLEEAEAAVQMFHQQEIDSRPVNVEIARPRGDAPARGNEGGRGRGGRGRGRGGRGGRGSGRRFRSFKKDEEEGNNEQPANDGERPNRPRAPRQPRRQNRNPSPDTLFVANLAFAMKDEELLDLFKEHNPTEAHVVVGRSGRSKGFGFVKFRNSEDQQSALKKDKVQSMGRVLTVKIALNPEPVQEGENAENKAAN